MTFWQKSLVSSLAMLLTQSVWASVVCTGATPARENIDLDFTITSNTANPPAGTVLSKAMSGVSIADCRFSGASAQERTVYFVNVLDANTKQLLRNSGIKVTQVGYNQDNRGPVDITAPSVPDLALAYWAAGTVNIGAFYKFEAIKYGSSAMYPIETGYVPLGYHTDFQGRKLGPQMYYFRMSTKMINLCPSPIITISSDQAGNTVNYGTMTASDFSEGKLVSKPFNLALRLSSCQIALSISVKFSDGSNTKEYTVLDNGLRLAILDAGQPVTFNKAYPKGSISPDSTKTINYRGRLSNPTNSPIKEGPFSKTVRVTVSYD